MNKVLCLAVVMSACSPGALVTPCPAGEAYAEGLCYRVIEEQVPALTAAERCAEIGGFVVAPPQSRAKADWLMDLTGGRRTWLGPTEDLWERARADMPCLTLEEDGALGSMTCWSVLDKGEYPEAYVCEMVLGEGATP